MLHQRFRNEVLFNFFSTVENRYFADNKLFIIKRQFDIMELFFRCSKKTCKINIVLGFEIFNSIILTLRSTVKKVQIDINLYLMAIHLMPNITSQCQKMKRRI